MITVTHNATDITDKIDPGDFAIADERNSNRDTCQFTIQKEPGGFAPELNAEIIVELDGERIFGGSVVSFETSVEEPPTVRYMVECLDFTHQADRKLITERLTDSTAEAIITSLANDYVSGFTVTNVDAPVAIESISFNRLTFSECLDKLAKLTGYYWYIDYHKDVHFFSRNSEPAPFDVTDDNDSHIPSTLRIRSDLSQLRNVVEVTGGETPITARTTKHAGDGETTEFATNFKFSGKPTVTVDGEEVTVGTEYIDTEGFDCYWSFQEKYVRFDDASIPAAPVSGATNIDITGQPLVPLVAVVPDNESIQQFGEFEYALTERSLRTQQEVIDRGLAELEAFAAQITEASFDTNSPGLRSGQIIRINSVLHGVNTTYVIQQAVFRPYPNGSGLDGTWSVSLASTATMTLVEALKGLLKEEDLEADELEVLLAFYRFSDASEGSDSVAAPETTQAPYLLADAAGNVQPGFDPFICNFARLGP